MSEFDLDEVAAAQSFFEDQLKCSDVPDAYDRYLRLVLDASYAGCAARIMERVRGDI